MMRARPSGVHARCRAALALALCVALALGGCDALIPEGANPGDVQDGPLPGLTPEERAAFVRGDQAFGRPFSPSEGLGPIFNDVSCAACHSADGRGRPENALVRFGEAPDYLGAYGGPQIQDQAIPGAVPELLPPGVASSVRLPPAVFGVGLIEAIPDAAILALADPDDADGDGISGRVNWAYAKAYVPDHEGGGAEPRVGRFGRKAQTGSLLQQVVEAYHQDMGITTDFVPDENVNPQASRATAAADRVADPELAAEEVRAVLAYLRGLAAPAPGRTTPERERGAQLFASVGCTACHVPELRTGTSSMAALSDQPVPLFSDLLLHDMGDALADGRADGSASGREWRTAPLWGLRVMRRFLNGEAFLLHDGRARNVNDAILLHGGEAQRARDAYANLTPEERAALLAYVESR
jgi:CxxC motif-containing protein (DUF1111 family)